MTEGITEFYLDICAKRLDHIEQAHLPQLREALAQAQQEQNPTPFLQALDNCGECDTAMITNMAYCIAMGTTKEFVDRVRESVTREDGTAAVLDVEQFLAEQRRPGQEPS